MKKWCTKLEAVSSETGETLEYYGDIIVANTWQEAQAWCNCHRGYLKVVGEYVGTVNIGSSILAQNNINYN